MWEQTDQNGDTDPKHRTLELGGTTTAWQGQVIATAVTDDKNLHSN